MYRGRERKYKNDRGRKCNPKKGLAKSKKTKIKLEYRSKREN